MVKDFRLEVDGETHDVDSPEEAAALADELEPADKAELVTLHVKYSDDEWIATVADPETEYEGRDTRKWGAILDLVETVDERAQRFGF